jgi:hypothetical protein
MRKSFTVIGAGTAAPQTPTLDDPKGYATFHPREVMTFSWTAVPGAVPADMAPRDGRGRLYVAKLYQPISALPSQARRRNALN